MHQSRSWMDWLTLIGAALLFLLVLLSPVMAEGREWSEEEKHLWQAYKNGELIRLHVVAHSNAPKDQAIKLAVRDAVIEAFAPFVIRNAKNDGHLLFQTLCNHSDTFQSIAESRAKELGFSGTITVQAGTMELPAKQYGQVLLPSGSYRALRITIGNGQGRNWWCVLYPQLCLALSASSTEKPVWSCSQIFRHWLALPVQKGRNML